MLTGLEVVLRDGCVYKKERSGNEEYCFMPSSRYTAECQDKADDGQQAVEVPGKNKQTNKQTNTNKIKFARQLDTALHTVPRQWR